MKMVFIISAIGVGNEELGHYLDSAKTQIQIFLARLYMNIQLKIFVFEC